MCDYLLFNNRENYIESLKTQEEWFKIKLIDHNYPDLCVRLFYDVDSCDIKYSSPYSAAGESRFTCIWRAWHIMYWRKSR